MTAALRHAGVEASRVGYVNAHGTGTPLNDAAESAAIRLALGSRAESVPVSSIKGAVGHLMAAAGAIEIAATLLAFERDLLPGTAHHTERDAEIPLHVVGEAPRPARVDFALSNSFGFGGQNATVVLARGRLRDAVHRRDGVGLAHAARQRRRRRDRPPARRGAGDNPNARFDASTYACPLGAAIPGEPAPGKHARFLKRTALFGVEAGAQAFAHAKPIASGSRLGLFYAVGGLRAHWNDILPALEAQQPDFAGSWERGLKRLPPFWMLHHLSNNAHALLAADLAAKGDGITTAARTRAHRRSPPRVMRSPPEASTPRWSSVPTRFSSPRRFWRWAPEVRFPLRPIRRVSRRPTPLSRGTRSRRGRGGGGPRASHGRRRACAGPRRSGRVRGRLPRRARPATLATTASRITRGDECAVDGAAFADPRRDRAEREVLGALAGPELPLFSIAAATGRLGAATSIVQLIALASLLRRGELPPIAALVEPAPGPLLALTRRQATSGRAMLGVSTGAPGLAAAIRVWLP